MKMIYFFASCMLVGVFAALVLTNPLGNKGLIPVDLNIDKIGNSINKLPDLGDDKTTQPSNSAIAPSDPVETQSQSQTQSPYNAPIDPVETTQTRAVAYCFREGYNAINLRAKPDINSTVLTMVDCGTPINVDKSTGVDNWVPVTYKGYKGWMFIDAVQYQ